MDRPRQNDHLGVNKTGKNIRKSPLHQPNFAANVSNNNNNNASSAAARPQSQPQVYNISKNDFRSIVQQLTGSPSRESLPRPPQNNSPKPQNTRLHRIRPAPLTEIHRPASLAPHPQQHHPHLVRPPPPSQPPFPQGTQQQQQPTMSYGNQSWSNTAESPVSEYMRYLQSSIGDSATNGNQMQPGHEQRPYMPAQPQFQPQTQPHMVPGSQPRMSYQSPLQSTQYLPPPGLAPSSMPPQPQFQPQPQAQPQQPQPHMMSGPQPRMNMQSPFQPNQYQPPPGLVPSPMPRNLPSPRFSCPVPVTPTLPSPRFNQMYGGFPSPRYNGFGPLHSPTSQFPSPSPTGYPNMYSPRSPYPLLSPGVQYPQPLTPNFSFSQISQQGSLGAGPGHPQPPPSPGLMFPLSPSGFFPIQSPRWSDY